MDTIAKTIVSTKIVEPICFIYIFPYMPGCSPEQSLLVSTTVADWGKLSQ